MGLTRHLLLSFNCPQLKVQRLSFDKTLKHATPQIFDYFLVLVHFFESPSIFMRAKSCYAIL
jgi:hypothetical protein